MIAIWWLGFSWGYDGIDAWFPIEYIYIYIYIGSTVSADQVTPRTEAWGCFKNYLDQARFGPGYCIETH